MTKTDLISLKHSKKSVLKEELEPEASHTLSEQNLKKWYNTLRVLLLECAEKDNPYTHCVLSCLQYMKFNRWQNLNPLQKLVVLSSLRTVMNNDDKLKKKIELQIDLMLFFKEYQALLKEVQQAYL